MDIGQMGDPDNLSLRLIIGGDRSNLYEIRDGESLTLGRDSVCNIQIDHPTVSPIHCRLDYGGGVLIATDLNSREGLFFRNRRWKRIEFKGDASFALGTLEISATTGPPITSPPGLRPPPGSLHGFRPPLVAGERPAAGPASWIRRRSKKAPSLPERLNGFLKRNFPFFAVSLAAHLVAGLLIADIPFLTRNLKVVKEIFANIDTKPDRIDFDRETAEPDPEFEDPMVPDPLPPVQAAEADPPEFPVVIPQMPMEIAVQGLGDGNTAASGLAGEGVAHLRGMSYSEGFSDYIQSLRDEGMDVAFVIDSTSSMLPFLDEAKRVVNQLISKLAAIVPNLRMALVIYRDEGDAYITRHLALTNDRYEILNFLEESTAGGGGDLPEAIYEALHRAVDSLYWRPQARKVIILVGDAPSHAEDKAKIEQLVRSFCTEENRGVVNAVYVGTEPEENGNGDPGAAVRSFREIVRLSGGEYAGISDYDNIVKHMIHLTFGSRWDDDLTRLLASVQLDMKSRIVERRSGEGRMSWLMESLEQVPVRPIVVQALIREASPEDLLKLTEFLESQQLPVETKWAVVYILRKKLERPVPFDPYESQENQRQEIQAIREAILGSAGSKK